MTQQHSCCVMCKFCSDQFIIIWMIRIKYPSNLNCNWNNFSETSLYFYVTSLWSLFTFIHSRIQMLCQLCCYIQTLRWNFFVILLWTVVLCNAEKSSKTHLNIKSWIILLVWNYSPFYLSFCSAWHLNMLRYANNYDICHSQILWYHRRYIVVQYNMILYTAQ